MIKNGVNLKTKPEDCPRSKTKVVNFLNPENFHGSEVSVFKQSVNYPPSKEDHENNNRINKEGTLFPSGKIIPQREKCEKCEN